MKGLSIQDLFVGQQEELSRLVTQDDINRFGEVTGDQNPVHHDPEFAANTIFKKPIAHGILSAGFISAVIGTKLPGPGSIYLSQNLKFLRPVYPGDEIKAIATVRELFPEKNRVLLATECLNQHNETVATGESLLMPSKL